jgi:hypothetical protein
MRLAWLLLALAGCATLNTAGMSEACKRLYDACLNTCPTALSPMNPTSTPNTNLQIDVAACTNDCNDRARRCQ